MKLFKHLLIMALALTACVGFTSCKDDDDDEDSKRPLTGYWVTEDGEEAMFIHPNGCGFGVYLGDGNPPEIYDIFESYVITKDKELVVYWLDDEDLSVYPESMGQIKYNSNTITFVDDYDTYTYTKKGNDYPYSLNFQNHGEDHAASPAELLNWWNSHTK